jgi:hypothetical protein
MERERLDDSRHARMPWPHGRHSGEDGTGRVRVELDCAARDVDVVLENGWRSAVGPKGLGAAVLQAFSAATIARLTAWATALATEQRLPPILPPTWPAARLTIDALAHAWRDLREFQHRLTTLHEATETVSSPGGLAVVEVARGQLVGLELDSTWLRTATSPDVERHIGHALGAALTLIAALPERALEGCPGLAALPGVSFSLSRSSHADS